MEHLTTFELLLLSSNTEYSLQGTVGNYRNAQEKLNEKIKAEYMSRPDINEALLLHLQMLNEN